MSGVASCYFLEALRPQAFILRDKLMPGGANTCSFPQCQGIQEAKHVVNHLEWQFAQEVISVLI